MERLTYRQTVGRVRAGDIVIHYRSPNVVALSGARENAKHYPVDRNASIRQGYFFPFDFEGTRAVLNCVDEPLPAWLSALVTRRTLGQSSNSRTEGSPGPSRGGGFGEPEQNTEVEQVAVRVVTEWYSNRGWEVVSVENQRCGFDLLCRRNGTEEHVEVKGVTGNDKRFIITAAELRQAKEDDRFVLALVRRALSGRPVVERWVGAVFCRDFAFDPVQYWAGKRDA